MWNYPAHGIVSFFLCVCVCVRVRACVRAWFCTYHAAHVGKEEDELHNEHGARSQHQPRWPREAAPKHVRQVAAGQAAQRVAHGKEHDHGACVICMRHACARDLRRCDERFSETKKKKKQKKKKRERARTGRK